MSQTSPATRPAATRSSLALAGLFFALHLVRLPFHELWRDEWVTWQVARASSSPAELLWNTRFDGHPNFWTSLVWIAGRLVPSVVAMQVLHAAVAAAAAFVVLRWAPFPRWLLVLFLCGYFPLFEYAVISRDYALGVLLAAVCCALVCSARLRPLALGAALGLLAWTTIYGAMLALAFLAILAIDAAGRRRLPATRLATRGRIWATCTLGAAGAALAILDAVPSSGAGEPTGWFLLWDAQRALRVTSGVFDALLPVPRPRLSFWNTNFLDGAPLVAGVLGMVLILGLGLTLRRSRPAWLFALLSLGALLAFSYTKVVGELRNHGFYFLALACAAWIAEASSHERGEPLSARRRRGLVVAGLGIHVLVAAYASAMDLRYPFSASVEAARWLIAHRLDGLPIVAEKDSRVSPIGALLDKPLFYVRGRRWGRFVVWDRTRQTEPTPADLLASVAAVAAARGPVLLVLSDPETRESPPGMELLAKFGPAIARGETYAVYLARQPAP